MRLLLAGDTHGNPRSIHYLYQTAFDHKCDAIFQLGDYGYWEHKNGGPEYLDVTSEFATLNDIPFYWLDGNHENHTWLRMTGTERDTGINLGVKVPAAPYRELETPEGFWPIRPNVFYSPRGHRFEWDDVTFMTFGGAYSVDRAYRKIGDSWWWEEEIDAEEVAAATADLTPIDVLLSHDLPNGVDMKGIMAKRGFDYRMIPASEKGRLNLRTVVEVLHPSQVYHGHYHTNYVEYVDYDHGTVRVNGLDCDETGKKQWTVFDTEDFNERRP